MSTRPRRNHSPAFKAKKALSELAEQFDVHANQITAWRAQLLEGAAGVFGGESAAENAERTVDVKTLHAKIGELRCGSGSLAASIRFNARLYLKCIFPPKRPLVPRHAAGHDRSDRDRRRIRQPHRRDPPW